MALKHIDEYRDAALSRGLIDKINRTSRTPVRLMEVCGTHTHSVAGAGLRRLMPKISAARSPPPAARDRALLGAFAARRRRYLLSPSFWMMA